MKRPEPSADSTAADDHTEAKKAKNTHELAPKLVELIKLKKKLSQVFIFN